MDPGATEADRAGLRGREVRGPWADASVYLQDMSGRPPNTQLDREIVKPRHRALGQARALSEESDQGSTFLEGVCGGWGFRGARYWLNARAALNGSSRPRR